MKGERKCQSPNHNQSTDEAIRAGRACRWKCPRCKRWLCSACEGTDDGLKVCDPCAARIYSFARGAYYDAANPPAAFVTLVRRWAFRGRVADVLAHAR